jgi:hypothetical protein
MEEVHLDGRRLESRWEEEVGYQTPWEVVHRKVERQLGEHQTEEHHLGERQLASGEESCRKLQPSRRARVEQKACRWAGRCDDRPFRPCRDGQGVLKAWQHH